MANLFGGYTSRAFLPSLNGVPLECGTPAVLVELEDESILFVECGDEGFTATHITNSAHDRYEVNTLTLSALKRLRFQSN